MSKIWAFLLVACAAACGGGGGGNSAPDAGAEGNVIDDVIVDDFRQPTPCGEFIVKPVPSTPGVYQCVSKTGSTETIAIYCSIRSECVEACNEAINECSN